MAQAHMVAFREVKGGNPDDDWEDGAGYVEDVARGQARCIVVDGATEAFGTLRWVHLLVNGFLDDPPAAPDECAFDHWLGRMQQAWQDDPAPPAAGPYALFESRKAESGSFATLLGCWFEDLHGPGARWTAASLGDCVLFHVRGGALLEHFPPMAPTDFGSTPDGASTRPANRDRMRAGLRFKTRQVAIGDRLYLASDALAAWMLRTATTHGGALWSALDALHHPAVFRRLVRDRRATGELKNDDVTLLRVVIAPGTPEALVVAP